MRRLLFVALLSALLSPLAARAGVFPPSYVELLRQENFTGLETLSAAAIAKAEATSADHPERLCSAFDQRARLGALHGDPFLSSAPIERALECRSRLPVSAKNSARIEWLNALLAQASAVSGDTKRAAALLKETAPQIKRDRVLLEPIDFALAAKALAATSYKINNLPGALEWMQTGIPTAHEPDVVARIVRSKFLDLECFYLGRLGRFAEAEKAGEQGARLAQEIIGAESGAYVDALFSLGQVEYFAQHFGAARKTLERAIFLARRLDSTFGKLSLSASLDMWANLLRHSGEYDKARAALQEAIVIVRTLYPTDASRLAAKLSNLASVESEAGNCGQSIALLHEAITLVEGHSGSDSIELVPKLSTLGLCELDIGDLAKARDDIARELNLANRTYGSGNAHLANPLLDMARVEIAQRGFAAARTLLEQALGAMPKDLDTFLDMRAAVERNLARALHGLGKDDEAFQHAVAAEVSRQRLLRRFAGVLDESTGLGLHSTALGGMDLVLALAAEPNARGRVERAWSLEMGSRLLITQLVAARLKAARQSSNPQIQSLWKVWEVANDAYANGLRQTPSEQPASSDLLASRDRLEAAERALAAHIPGLGASIDLDFSSVRDALQPRSVLIGFASAYADGWTSEHARSRDGDARVTFAFVLAAGVAPTLTALGDSDTLSRSVRQWTAALRDPASPMTSVDRLGSEVRRRIWDPLNIPDDTHEIYIVPDGELHRVAWLALPVRRGMLVETGAVPHVLDNERDILPIAAEPAQERLMLVGAVPVVAGEMNCGAPPSSLPGARHELDAIRDQWDRHDHDTRAFYLAGSSATKSAVLADMQKSSIVHFATHAVSGNADCTAAAKTSRSLGVAVPSKEADESAVAKLLLAANEVSKSGNEVLTAADILSLRLDTVDLVTLAACDTGLGPVLRDEGVFGLARAFHLAGARDVVMSLWEVNDAATADLMARMYRAHWREGVDVAEALAAAAHDLLDTRRAAGQSIHPYYWAAFVADGDRR